MTTTPTTDAIWIDDNDSNSATLTPTADETDQSNENPTKGYAFLQ